MKTIVQPQLLSVKEIATILGFQYKYMYRMIHRGEFPFVFRIGGRWVADVKDLQEYIEQRKKGLTPKKFYYGGKRRTKAN